MNKDWIELFYDNTYYLVRKADILSVNKNKTNDGSTVYWTDKLLIVSNSYEKLKEKLYE